jgi:hypothetical protein
MKAGDPNSMAAYLPQFDSPIAADGTRTPTPWIAHPDNVDKFYETGKTYTNSVAVTGGNDKADFRLGFTNLTKPVFCQIRTTNVVPYH